VWTFAGRICNTSSSLTVAPQEVTGKNMFSNGIFTGEQLRWSWRFTTEESEKSLTHGYVGILRGIGFRSLVVSLIRLARVRWRNFRHRFVTWAGMVKVTKKLDSARKKGFSESPVRPLKYGERGVVPGCDCHVKLSFMLKIVF